MLPMEPNQSAKRHAPAADRNRAPILSALRRHLPERGDVLEIASGTGQHAVFCATYLPERIWQPSDPDPANRDSIAAWATEAGLHNMRAPLALDATDAAWKLPRLLDVRVVVCINMIHISPWAAAEGLIRNAAHKLPKDGVLFLYGPYKRGGQHTAPSNEAFDASLRERNPAWGVRDLDDVTALAAGHGFTRVDVIDMPANNLSVVFRRA
ncbi:MAG: DUF938 domain-containing protein [Alphaproteobacteria bacterium]